MFFIKCFHPLAGKLIWKAACVRHRKRADSGFPSPCGEVDLERRESLPESKQWIICFHPLAGKLIWKARWRQVAEAICCRFHPLAGKLIWKDRGVCDPRLQSSRFHPLAGKLIWKGTLHKSSLRYSTFPSPCGEVDLERVNLWKPYRARVLEPYFHTTFFIFNKCQNILNK